MPAAGFEQRLEQSRVAVENAVGILGATTEYRQEWTFQVNSGQRALVHQSCQELDATAQDLRRRGDERADHRGRAVRPVVIGSHGGSELVCLGETESAGAVAVNVHQPRDDRCPRSCPFG